MILLEAVANEWDIDSMSAIEISEEAVRIRADFEDLENSPCGEMIDMKAQVDAMSDYEIVRMVYGQLQDGQKRATKRVELLENTNGSGPVREMVYGTKPSS